MILPCLFGLQERSQLHDYEYFLLRFYGERYKFVALEAITASLGYCIIKLHAKDSSKL